MTDETGEKIAGALFDVAAAIREQSENFKTIFQQIATAYVNNMAKQQKPKGVPNGQGNTKRA